MALWSITKIRPVEEGQSTLDCIAPGEPRQITLKDSTTGTVQTVQMCWDPTVPVCDNLNLLEATFTPGDWHAECHP